MIPTTQDVIDMAHQMLWVCLLLSLPTLLTALLVGVTVSMVQTVTSIQEMTLTFVPKLVAVVGMVAMSLTWIIEVICQYFEETLRVFSSYYQ